jgi:heme/copper-type cytochrome/quinol oxidase subunit 2
MMGSMLALVGIAIGAAATLNYSLAPVKTFLQSATMIEVNGLSPTIPLELGVSPWFIIIPVLVLFTFFAQKSYRRENKTKRDPLSLFGQSWPWWFAGIMVGIIAVISYPVAEAAGRTTPLAMTGGYVGILATIVTGNLQSVGWEQAMVVGAILGAAIAALMAREWKIRIPPVRMLGQSILGGLIMGIGAVLGDGCNITTILIGVPLLSLGGILAGGFTILGCWTTAYLLFK